MTYKDVRTTTGSNIRHILTENDFLIVPGETKKYDMKKSYIYDIPEGQEWKIGLLSSLLEIRDGKWEILFDNEEGGIIEDDIKRMIDGVCVN